MGNRSSGIEAGNVPRIYVRYPGVLVRAEICVPRAHPHAAWLLPWVEALLKGRSLAELVAAPPWPLPPERPLVAYLRDTLLDLRWAVPDWSSPNVVVAPQLREAFARDGRAGLARVLFDAEVVRGEWWADALGGTMLSRRVATSFDWDGKRRHDEALRADGDPLARIEGSDPDFGDLLRKLGQVDSIDGTDEHAFLAGPFVVEESKDLLFPMFGEHLRVLPDELAELEPVLRAHAPHLLGQKRATRSRIVRLATSPVEPIAAEIERLPAEPSALGPIGPARERIERLGKRIEEARSALETWLRESVDARPVIGPTQRHFDAVAEVCASLPADREPLVLITSAFLNAENARAEDGIADALARAPASTRFLVLYGHANDDLPAVQRRDADAWVAALLGAQPTLTGRVTVLPGKRRSHEKVLLSSTGDWMVGSWNAASSRPHATVFEASLSGRDPGFARKLLGRVGDNVEGDAGAAFVDALGRALGRASGPARAEASGAITALLRACTLAARALPQEDGSRAGAWASAVRALRAAFAPFRTAARLDLLDEQQTRDALVAHVRAARRDVLLTSDRLVEGALDRAMLRDLRGDGRNPRLVRVVWGREWAGRKGGDAHAREQLKRARRAVRDAREAYGDALLASEEPMENHAKLLVADGLRGLLTSENLLSYGGEKDAYESRELGVAFWAPVVARSLLGRALLRWPDVLAPESAGRSEPPLGWAVAGNEVWHALAPLAGELGFDWEAPAYVGAVVADELGSTEDGRSAEARREAWATLPGGFSRAREEAERLGLVHPSERWRPWDAPAPARVEALLADAERAIAALPAVPNASPRPEQRTTHPLIERVVADMVRIPAGSFWMGDDRVLIERPRHRVHITRPFLLGRTPVTQDLWKAVMGWLPHLENKDRDPRFPVVQVTYEQMQEFVSGLNALPGGGGFELPTEAQWEYACRAGSSTHYFFGDHPGGGLDEPGELERYAWTKRNARGRLHAVGELQPNRFGLLDMHGLVYETMRDTRRRFTPQEVRDPVGPLPGTPAAELIAARGGSWGRRPLQGGPESQHFRSASRQYYEKSHRVSLRLSRRIEE